MICPLRMPQFQNFWIFSIVTGRKCVLNLRFCFRGELWFSKREKRHFQKIPQRLFIWVKSSPSNVKISNILFENFPIRAILNITCPVCPGLPDPPPLNERSKGVRTKVTVNFVLKVLQLLQKSLEFYRHFKNANFRSPWANSLR